MKFIIVFLISLNLFGVFGADTENGLVKALVDCGLSPRVPLNSNGNNGVTYCNNYIGYYAGTFKVTLTTTNRGFPVNVKINIQNPTNQIYQMYMLPSQSFVVYGNSNSFSITLSTNDNACINSDCYARISVTYT